MPATVSDAPAPDPTSETNGTATGRAHRRRVFLILVLSAVGHVGLLAVTARMTPPAPPEPRSVEVMSFEAVAEPGGAAIEWRNEGGRRNARIRPDPAAYSH